MDYPKSFSSEAELDQVLSIPYPEAIDLMSNLDGDIMILGVAGKMGPSLAQLAQRACKEAGIKKKIIGVSRFSDKKQKEKLEQKGIQTISCDLSIAEEVDKLPLVKNIIFMAGRKFGSVGSESLTWLMNTIVPGNVARRFKNSRIVVFSTGCVYALTSASSGGGKENDSPLPIGEYANTCLGRERIFEYYSNEYKTPLLIYRLNYAIDLRYGVLMDIARKVYSNEPVDLNVSHVNFIWQGDANNRALLSLAHTIYPMNIVNITGADTLSVKELALEFGKLFQKEVKFTGKDAGHYYLSNATKSMKLFGPLKVSTQQMIEWTAEWLKQGGAILGRPTHFSVTDGQFLS